MYLAKQSQSVLKLGVQNIQDGSIHWGEGARHMYD